MIVLCECRFCGQPVEFDARGVRWHGHCADKYQRSVRGQVIGVMVFMGFISMILLGIFGVLALGGVQ